MLRAIGPTRASIRSRICPAALFVKVIARMENGGTPRSRMRWATLRVSTAVLPLPAPATTSSGPSAWTAASRWAALSSPSTSSSFRAGFKTGASCSILRLSTGLGAFRWFLSSVLRKPQHRGQGRKNPVRSLCQVFPRQLEDGPAAQCEEIALGAISLPLVAARVPHEAVRLHGHTEVGPGEVSASPEAVLPNLVLAHRHGESGD